MKFSSTKENLGRGLAIVSHISGKNANLPVLNNILFEAEVGGLKLTATNLDMTISCTTRAKVDQGGMYTLPAKLIADYINLLPDERVDIDLIDNAAAIVCGKSKTKMHGIPAGEFPATPKVSGGVTFSVDAKELDEGLGQTLFSVATSEARQILTGAFMAFDGEHRIVTIAATDSYRLGERMVSLKGDTLGERRAVVPARTLSEVRRILGLLRDAAPAPEVVDIELTDSQVAFRFSGVEISSRLIDGTFPDYRQIIPKTFTTEMILDRPTFIQAVKRASLFSKSALLDVRLEANPDKGEVVISALETGRGEHTVEVEGEVSGVENIITLNYRYVLDGLSAMSTQKVKMRIIDATNPCVINPLGASENYMYIVMPIRQ
jgi:DNA polymerase-3 subunit beta